MKIQAFLLSSILLFSNSIFAKPAESVRNAIASAAKVSIGGIVSGSAVAIKSYGSGTLFLSNDHVCQWSRGKALFAETPNYVGALNSVATSLIVSDGQTLKGRVVYVSNHTNPVRPSVVADDLCLIYVEKSISVAVASPEDAEVGEEVFSVGAPHGWFPHIAGGYVGGYAKDRASYIGSASLVVGEGSSGGGLFEKVSGNLVGVVFAIEPVVDSVPAPLQTYYVPVSRVKHFINKYEMLGKKKKENPK